MPVTSILLLILPTTSLMDLLLELLSWPDEPQDLLLQQPFFCTKFLTRSETLPSSSNLAVDERRYRTYYFPVFNQHNNILLSSKAIFLQLITALGALSGCAVSLLAEGIGEAATAWILPFTAGGFIYIAAVSVIPELLENSKFSQSIKEMVALFAGIYMMVLIAKYE